MERVKEIYHLFKKHQFQIAGLRSFGRYISDEDVAPKRALAEELRSDPDKFARLKTEAAVQLDQIPVMSKGVKSSNGAMGKWLWLAAGLGVVGLWAIRRARPRAKFNTV